MSQCEWRADLLTLIAEPLRIGTDIDLDILIWLMQFIYYLIMYPTFNDGPIAYGKLGSVMPLFISHRNNILDVAQLSETCHDL